MPTTRLMRFSSAGRSAETYDEIGQQSIRSQSGVSSAHFLKLVEERGQIGFWTSEFTKGHVTASVGLYRLLGIDPSLTLCRDDMIKIMHPDDRPSQHEMYETMHSGHAIDREFRIIRPDGTVRWLHTIAEVIVDTEGRPVRAVGLMVDVTEQHAARRSVEEGWHRYKTLVAAIAAMECRALACGEIVAWPGWEELTGQTAAEMAEWGWLQAIHPDDREATRLDWISSLENSRVHAVDYRVRCADGQYRWFLARAAPLFNQDGTVREWMGALIGMAGDNAVVKDGKDGAVPTLEAAHIRAARALLNWSLEDLAFKARVSVSSVRRLERNEGNSVRGHLLKSVCKTFESYGVSFGSGANGVITISLGKNL
jgi:PAS domain S-box-containing protein